MEIPEKVCALPLGMENKKIPDSAIVASSRYSYRSDNYGPARGRLNNQGKCFLSLDVINFATNLRRLDFNLKKNRLVILYTRHKSVSCATELSNR